MLHFDGGDDRVDIPDNELHNFGTSTDFILEAWIKITGGTTNFDGIITKGGVNWYQLVVFNNKLAAEINGSGQIGPNNGLIGTTNVNDGNEEANCGYGA